MAVIAPNFIYVHVPKTGGSSVAAALGGTTLSVPMHVPARCLAHLGRPMFGFLRNPWEYVVSLYFFLWQSPPRHRRRVNPEAIKAMGFKRWLLEGETFMSNEPVDGTIWHRDTDSYRPGAYPGIDKLDHSAWGLPPQQRRPLMWYLDGCDRIGRVETMQVDLDAFMDEYGGRRVALERLNRTKAKPGDWRAVHDAETIDHVNQCFAADIAAGGYAFE